MFENNSVYSQAGREVFDALDYKIQQIVFEYQHLLNQGHFGWFAEACGQTNTHWDAPESYSFAKLLEEYLCGRLYTVSLYLGETPESDREIHTNQKCLSIGLQKASKDISESEGRMTWITGHVKNGCGDADGYIAWTDYLRVSNYEGVEQQVYSFDHGIALEIGQQAMSKTLVHLNSSILPRMLARWPYGSRFLHLLYRPHEGVCGRRATGGKTHGASDNR